jgi:hypothetical protein
MAIVNTSKLDTFDTWRVKTNTTAEQLGDHALLGGNLTLTSDTVVDAVIEVLTKVETEVGIIGALTTTAPTLVGAINEHDAEIGVISSLTTTDKSTLVSAINELDSEIGVLTNLDTSAQSTIVAAINELNSEHGVLSTLTTTEKGTFVGSINEIVSREDSRYSNTVKLDLEHTTVGGTNNSTQDILSNLKLPSGKTFTIDGTLDISEGTLTVGGGSNAKLNINTTFIGLGDVDSAVAPSGGLIINRGTDYKLPGDDSDDVIRSDVRVYWDSTDNQWHLKRVVVDPDTGVETAITPYILDNVNFSDVISGGTQSGIAVTYQTSDNTLDFDVNDFTITLTGDVTGEATVTNLGDVSITTTVGTNKVELGTDTTGAYVQTLQLDPTAPGISFTSTPGTGGESTDITLLKVDSSVVRTAGAQSIAGVKTFSDKPIFNDGITVGDASTDTSLFKGDVTFDNNVEVKGNLVVTGTTTTVNSTEVNLADNILLLNSDFVGYPDIADLGTGEYTAPSENVGIKVNRGYSDAAGNPLLAQPELVWNESEDDWSINNGSNSYYIAGKLEAAKPAGVTADGIVVTQDATEKAKWTIAHADTSTQASVDNSNGNVIQDITLDGYGHITAITSADLDGRYYTETEADNNFVNVSGDTMSGDLTMDYWGTLAAPGFTANFTGDNNTKEFILPYYLDNADKILSVKVSGTVTSQYTFSGRKITFTNTPANNAPIEITGRAPRLVRGDLVGNSLMASESRKWSDARTIELTGNVTGQVSIDGSSNVSFIATVADNSHNHTASNISDFDTSVSSKISAMLDTNGANKSIQTGIALIVNSNGYITANTNDFTIELSGFVTGEGTVNNLGNVTISTAIDGTNASFETAVRALMPKIYNSSGNLLFPPSS